PSSGGAAAGAPGRPAPRHAGDEPRRAGPSGHCHVRTRKPPCRTSGRRSTMSALLALAAAAGLALLAPVPALAAATPVKPVKTWTGRVPAGVPPPLVSSLATQ